MTYDHEKYQETIKICQLSRDLKILPAGDLTEIGEKGINLSGGQKARVSLARAVYSDSEIMLMDDPISALDANVKKKIFKQVFMRKFAGKTRVLVTHAVDFLHLVDTIILLKKGRVVMKGNYQDLKDSEYLKEVIGIHQSNQSTRVQKFADDAVADSGSSPIDELMESLDDVESQSDSSSLGSHSEDEKEEDEPTAINDETVRNFRKNKKNDKLMRSFSVGASSSSNSSIPQSGKIMTNENEEDNKVGLDAYKKYLKYLGGWKFIVLSQLAMVGFTSFKILSDYQVGNWASSPD